MKISSIFALIAAILLFTQSSFGQGGPYLIDYLSPKAWPNPVWEFQPNWLDPDLPASVLQGQTVMVASRKQLELKHKDYYVFFDDTKQNGSAEGGWVSSQEHMAYLEWMGYIYPDPAEVYEAIPLNQLDPACFQKFNGPYAQFFDNPTFLGQVGGYWVAVSGLSRAMGGQFNQYQIKNIRNINHARNNGLKSDLRAQLVNQFLALHPEISPSEIPVDTWGNTLSLNANADNYAEVAHILPAIAPEGNGCGRNAYRNALLVSSNMKDILEEAGLPSPAFIQYCEFLGTISKSVPQPIPSQPITYTRVDDVRRFMATDVEYLDEDETRTVIEHVDSRTATPRR